MNAVWISRARSDRLRLLSYSLWWDGSCIPPGADAYGHSYTGIIPYDIAQ